MDFYADYNYKTIGSQPASTEVQKYETTRAGLKGMPHHQLYSTSIFHPMLHSITPFQWSSTEIHKGLTQSMPLMVYVCSSSNVGLTVWYDLRYS